MACNIVRFPPGFDPTLREGNPNYSHRMQLYCRHRYHLIINPDGTIEGDNNDTNPYGLLEFSSVDFGVVQIRGIEANLYLAFNDDGELYGEKHASDEATIFTESYADGYNSYLSKKYEDQCWFVGIKKNGKAKNGRTTQSGQKAIQFLPRRIPNNEENLIFLD